MGRGILALTCLFLSGRCAAETADAQLERAFSETVRPFLTSYCMGCHSDKVRSGGLASAKISRPQLSSGGAGVVIGPMAPDQPGPVPALTRLAGRRAASERLLGVGGSTPGDMGWCGRAPA